MITSDYISRFVCLVSAAIAAISSTAASAQPDGDEWIVTIGGGAQVFPEYPGADDVEIFPLPIFDFRRAGEPLPVDAPDDGFSLGVMRILGEESAFDFGPVVAFQPERDVEDVGAPVGEVDFTVEAGAFAHFFVTPQFRLRVEGRRGVGGHDGWVGHVGADYVYRRADLIFTIGPRARLADDTYHDAYFSVSPQVATATGLPAFDADGGFHAVGLASGARWQFHRDWGVHLYAAYDRLVGDAEDSPIVQTFGDADQFSAGVALSYTFSMGRF